MTDTSGALPTTPPSLTGVTPAPTTLNVNLSTVAPGPQKSPGATFLLTLLLGYVGAHRFYLRQYGMGVLYACTVGLLGVGWFIDLFRARSLTDRYNLRVLRGLR